MSQRTGSDPSRCPSPWAGGPIKLLAAVCATSCAVATPPPPEIPPGLTAIPISVDGRDSPESIHTAFLVALELPDESLDALASSDDPDHRAVAIVVASARADVVRLFQWRQFLDDHRPALPTCVPAGLFAPDWTFVPSTVSERIASALGYWFGISGGGRASRFEQEFASHVENPLRLVNPWLMRLRDAMGWDVADTESSILLKQEIAALDPALRWAIVAQAHHEGRYTDEQAAALYLALPPEIKANITNGVRMLSFDPTYSLDDSARAREDELQLHARAILELADALPVTPPPDPPPQP